MKRRPPRRLHGIIYLPQIREKNWSKHGVSEQEVLEAFSGAALFRFQERGQRRGEDLYTAMSQTGAGRYLVVFFIHKVGGQALILSARDMTATEKRYYEARQTGRLRQK